MPLWESTLLSPIPKGGWKNRDATLLPIFCLDADSFYSVQTDSQPVMLELRFGLASSRCVYDFVLLWCDLAATAAAPPIVADKLSQFATISPNSHLLRIWRLHCSLPHYYHCLCVFCPLSFNIKIIRVQENWRAMNSCDQRRQQTIHSSVRPSIQSLPYSCK